MLDMRRSALRRTAVLAAVLVALASGAAAATPSSFLAMMTLAPAALAVAPEEGPAATTSFGAVPADGLTRKAVVVSSANGGTIERIAVEDGRRFAVLDPNDCTGRALPAGSECTIAVVAVPHGARAATLEDRLLVQIDGTTREGQVTAWAR